jgi:hypothetical protein
MALGTSRGRESEREMQDGTTDRMRMAFVLEDWDCVPMEVKRLAVFYCTHQLDTLADIAFFFCFLQRRMCRFGCERRIHDRRDTFGFQYPRKSKVVH